MVDPSEILLGDMKVVVTRPDPELGRLCSSIEQHGGQAIPYPTMEIQPLAPTSVELPFSDIVLFISRNAVRYGIAAYPQLKQPGEGGLIGVVGSGTAETLLQLTHRPIDLIPTQGFDSEGLLALPQLQHVESQRIHIIKGKGGRRVLQNLLTGRGAEVITSSCYQRTLPEAPPISPWLNGDKIDMVITTSNATLENLVKLTPEAVRGALFDTMLIVVSKRGKSKAEELGFSHEPILAAGADDQSLLQALHQWRQRGRVSP